jgi:hypothetical protein
MKAYKKLPQTGKKYLPPKQTGKAYTKPKAKPAMKPGNKSK